MSSDKIITPSDLPLAMREQSINSRQALSSGVPLISTLEKVEKTKILDALQKTGWVQAKAARLIGITSRQIGYKIKKYGIKLTEQNLTEQ